jgi:N-methylhydantoinase A
MLLADERHDFIRTLYCDLSSLDFKALKIVHDEMASEAKKSLRNVKNAQWQIALDLRYVGQEFTLSVPVSYEAIKKGERQKIRAAFDALYEHRYSHQSPDEPVEMVNIRLAAIGKRPTLRFPRLAKRTSAKPSRRREVYLADWRKPVSCPVYQRRELGAGVRLKGPALIEEHGTTTVLFAADRCVVAPSGELIIDVGGAR